MSKIELSKLKTVIQETMIKLGREGSISSGAVIEAVRKNNPEAIRSISTELENMAMHDFFSRIAALTPKDDRQAELFSEYRGVHQFITVEAVRDGHAVVEWKLLSEVTLRELGTWLRRDRKKPSTKRQRNPGMTKMLRDLSKAAKGKQDITVGAALALRAAHGSGGKK